MVARAGRDGAAFPGVSPRAIRAAPIGGWGWGVVYHPKPGDMGHPAWAAGGREGRGGEGWPKCGSFASLRRTAEKKHKCKFGKTRKIQFRVPRVGEAGGRLTQNQVPGYRYLKAALMSGCDLSFWLVRRRAGG